MAPRRKRGRTGGASAGARPKRSGADKPIKAARAGSDNSTGTPVAGFDLTELRRLIRLVQRTGIGEIELAAGGRSVRIAAASGAPVTSLPPVHAAPAAGSTAPKGEAAEPPREETAHAVVSPMVGTFYRAPAPDADPYVEVGDVVEVGQTICIIEAMKLMNEIESEVSGRVVKILVENAQPIEYGQKLFLVEKV